MVFLVITIIVETAALIALLLPDIKYVIEQEKQELIEKGRQLEREQSQSGDGSGQNSCLWWLAHADDYYDFKIKEKKKR